ncbi:hypothetical protein ACFWU5_16375 [Nocardia sp. NPDC058640]|uniref:hypothetical protein n=1 Tax=Nocardia sp. NPDC058640 TaxID=3346571 RepID=UPI003655CEFF
MIREVTYYQAICDKCGVSAHEGGDFSAWADATNALAEAEGCDWTAPGPASLTVDGPHYCPDCTPAEPAEEATPNA